MDDQLEMNPTGLLRDQLTLLTEHANRAEVDSPGELADRVSSHLNAAIAAHVRNCMVNVRLCRALAHAINAALAVWVNLTPSGRYWLAGAILYFAKSHDDESDFQSPIGFEDDAEILNACLRFAGLEKLCVKPEEYDDV